MGLGSVAPIEVPSRDDFGDAELVARLRRGDSDAYEEVIRELGGRLLATAQRMTGNEEDAREALQDAFLSAFRNIHRFDAKSRFSTWMHRIVINACLMKLRAKRRRPTVSLEDLGQTRNGEETSPAAHVIASWREKAPDELDEELQQRVREEVEHLPEDYRTIIMLRDIEELDTDEAATVLGISHSAVKTRLHRARLALRERLDKYFRESVP